MSHRGLITLPPTRADLAVSRAFARAATPGLERVLQIVTWLADEKIVLGAAVLFWAYARLGRPENEIARRADHMLCCVAVAGVLPHVFKRWSTANARIASWFMAAATGYRALVTPGTRSHPDTRFTSAQ
jgi:hypothetical protein